MQYLCDCFLIEHPALWSACQGNVWSCHRHKTIHRLLIGAACLPCFGWLVMPQARKCWNHGQKLHLQVYKNYELCSHYFSDLKCFFNKDPTVLQYVARLPTNASKNCILLSKVRTFFSLKLMLKFLSDTLYMEVCWQRI
jgi:hypothetical protein